MIHDDLIKELSSNYGVDPKLVTAIIAYESDGNELMMRCDYRWKNFHFARAWAEKLGLTFETETICQLTYWGLTQILGATARENGFEGHLVGLLDPRINIEFCCKELKRLFVRYGNEMDVVAAYRHGSCVKTMGKLYSNEHYVDGVYKHLRKLRALV